MNTFTDTELDADVTYDDSPEAAKAIADKLLAWFKKTGHYSGESIEQSDNTYIEAPGLLSEIAEDLFKFDATYRE